jgi:hypothetical protein
MLEAAARQWLGSLPESEMFHQDRRRVRVHPNGARDALLGVRLELFRAEEWFRSIRGKTADYRLAVEVWREVPESVDDARLREVLYGTTSLAEAERLLSTPVDEKVPAPWPPVLIFLPVYLLFAANWCAIAFVHKRPALRKRRRAIARRVFPNLAAALLLIFPAFELSSIISGASANFLKNWVSHAIALIPGDTRSLLVLVIVLVAALAVLVAFRVHLFLKRRWWRFLVILGLEMLIIAVGFSTFVILILPRFGFPGADTTTMDNYGLSKIDNAVRIAGLRSADPRVRNAARTFAFRDGPVDAEISAEFRRQWESRPWFEAEALFRDQWSRQRPDEEALDRFLERFAEPPVLMGALMEEELDTETLFRIAKGLQSYVIYREVHAQITNVQGLLQRLQQEDPLIDSYYWNQFEDGRALPTWETWNLVSLFGEQRYTLLNDPCFAQMVRDTINADCCESFKNVTRAPDFRKMLTSIDALPEDLRRSSYLYLEGYIRENGPALLNGSEADRMKLHMMGDILHTISATRQNSDSSIPFRERLFRDDGFMEAGYALIEVVFLTRATSHDARRMQTILQQDALEFLDELERRD